MKKIFLSILIFLQILALFGQSRRLSTTRSLASQSDISIAVKLEPNYDPVITRLGKVVDYEDGIAYVKIRAKYNNSGDGYYYFYSCNIKAEATAILKFSGESYRDIYAMNIEEGSCDKGDYVYLRFVPRRPSEEDI